MTLEFIAILAAGAALGGFVNGLAGFGTAMFALGFWLQILPPLEAVSLVALMSVISGLQGVWVVRSSVLDNPGRLARFLMPALVGIPMGIAALSVFPPLVIKLVIAAMMILYGGFFSLRSALPRFERPTPIADGFVGFLGGVLGGAASLSGALPTMWCSMRPWPKAEIRAVLQPFNVIVLGLTAVGFAIKGVYGFDSLKLFAVTLPVTLTFAQIGIITFKRLNDDQFRRLIIALMFISGTVLLAREFFW
ncbi:sulfite exporter TauE/SafE family protein [Hoeflea sp. YIM 152468]|uniref:sulfite exporter TauE/SafE family protein n=1 Tax=Hoeflea sp. YIM 152468 TaxID=3031759 RepID=UPI0023DCD952|nr:sulfite exporter TauE/SafE family protein [Hoeflea sp. YIM 152468]MDF1609816.1 sulfite exporter TauE/SafE family protein [Hoeflea sp. YIM 152468]